jgi:hypothetical protein
MGEALGQQLIVENGGGAAGTISVANLHAFLHNVGTLPKNHRASQFAAYDGTSFHRPAALETGPGCCKGRFVSRQLLLYNICRPPDILSFRRRILAERTEAKRHLDLQPHTGGQHRSGSAQCVHIDVATLRYFIT